MLRALRAQVQQALAEAPARRKPALRRSDDPGALLATDLPLAADAAAVEAFVQRMTAQGWRIREEKSWLLLDADVPAPEFSPVQAQGELGCCLSLLSRHGGSGAPKEDIRAIVKAAEAGTLERLCLRLHREWAALLRLHQPLPGGLKPYLCRAAQDIQKEADT